LSLDFSSTIFRLPNTPEFVELGFLWKLAPILWDKGSGAAILLSSNSSAPSACSIGKPIEINLVNKCGNIPSKKKRDLCKWNSMNAQVGTGMANAYDYDSLDWQISVP
jgi:hypothetical protein